MPSCIEQASVTGLSSGGDQRGSGATPPFSVVSPGSVLEVRGGRLARMWPADVVSGVDGRVAATPLPYLGGCGEPG